MLRFSKSLAKLAPKQKAIQEKYGNDPAKMRQEVGRLMQEEGVSVGAGAMGCLPAFLQMPIWLALAPMLYFTFELRHQGAFFGLFQHLSGGSWSFFADLAEPDHFLRFGREFHIPLISSLMGPIDGLNVMPLLMGVVFYIQQKYLQPPSATPMTPEQEQQMKIMKVMTVVLFPLMMYNAPSGLALYFFTNSTLAIIESKHIRSRAERLGLDQPPPKRKAADGKPGFLARMAQLAEERQKMMEEARKIQARKDKGKK
jgi:YidC/Oxa1 family membrane protein insertase